ncbi:MAG: Ditrans,polycis-undecaprenyl-diphosphate synthase ((2E,6E)-farnesyl-diphosphate specific) [Chlamydiales bacterium]|nr:Ditrans,polycis-undecaprenyl-diphosphate synthase ((2E,6E)-farnesyl-diphosphate specific) [Chlamydiales bacterium]MCH9635968.1 Ditrans,polycis-undecaprenyl-diphosphate synthase ((2E,6E)-farnesyl-diphosphate specific) [Chlamydiales bacterium]
MAHYQPEELAQITKMPQHVSIVMDGNRRWAKKRGLLKPGHWQGADNVDTIVEAAAEMGISELTLYAFSTENWNRSKSEVKTLLKIMEVFLRDKCDKMVQNSISMGVIGDVSAFPEKIQNELKRVHEATRYGTRMRVTIAINYGGRDEICRACNRLLERAKRGEIDRVTEELFDDHLDTSGLAPLDLFIRTSGEMRVSNFLLWQLSYAEIYLTETLWPDFTPKELLEAVLSFGKRKRRVGK